MATQLELVGCADVDLDRAQATAGLLGMPGSLATSPAQLRATVQSDVDLLLVAVPPGRAPSALRDVAWDGLSCLVEKPFTLDRAELADAAALAAARHLRVEIVNNYRWRPDLSRAAALVAAGRIGTPRFGRLHMLASSPWEGLGGTGTWRVDTRVNPTGVVGDKGYHLAYLAEALAGSRLVDLAGVATGFGVTGSVDCWASVGRTEGRCVWSLFTTWSDEVGGGTDLIEVTGSGGRIVVGPTPGTVVLQRGDDEEVFDVGAGDGWGYQGEIAAALAGRHGNDLANHTRLADLLTGLVAG
jgi:predicted dehydrogenase